MRRMDPDFEAAFSKEDPEGYREAKHNDRKSTTKGQGATLEIHVPLIPQGLIRFAAGVLVLFVVIGGYFFFTGGAGFSSLSIPSGETFRQSAVAGPDSTIREGLSTISDPSTELGEKIAPLGKVGEEFIGKILR